MSLWSQPKAFAIRDVGGVLWCEVLSEGSQAARMLCLAYFFPLLFGICLCPLALTHSISPLASSEEQVMAEGFTASPLVETAQPNVAGRQK